MRRAARLPLRETARWWVAFNSVRRPRTARRGRAVLLIDRTSLRPALLMRRRVTDQTVDSAGIDGHFRLQHVIAQTGVNNAQMRHQRVRLVSVQVRQR